MSQTVYLFGIMFLFMTLQGLCLANERDLNTAIQTRYIKKLDQHVSFLGLGTVELGRDWGIDKQNSIHPSEKNANEILQAAFKNGIHVVDTATSYQLSEERIGRYLPQSQYSYLLITKPGEHSILANDPRCKIPAYDHIYCRLPGAAYDFTRAAIYKDVEESLQKLRVKKIDVALLHLDSKTAAEVMQHGEALQALAELKKQGKVGFIGVSINGEVAKQSVMNEDIDIIELEYSLLNQNNKEAIDIAYSKGIGVIIRGGLGTGLLTPYVAQHINDPNLPYGDKVRALLKLTNYDYQKLTELALAFLYQDSHISTVIVGADKVDFIQQDIKFLNHFHDYALLEKAKKAVAKYKTPNDFTEIMGEYYQDKNLNKTQ